MSACLLDANVLIALFDADHVHHAVVRDWFIALRDEFATCPIVEGALTRWIVRIEGRSGTAAAQRELKKLATDSRHRFWADDLAYADIEWQGVLGYGQVTDAYLAALARKHGGRLVTIDRGLAALHHDVAELIPDTITLA
ncbi:MAG: PIN domain-containing protein [Azonexus sp.]|jgi:toxin-antitoxin system PIN domain toxin|uniref:TA system VapC family ribonuclease toxin n=1 Tax=Azonexus sp. TaxID=1872668 RepID=UPI002817B5D6|nr:TA system VapC family ribonuclease toxin [Azonexus sp.]MDR0775185.1 PIN domain-containing protein [Azonexus sp.]